MIGRRVRRQGCCVVCRRNCREDGIEHLLSPREFMVLGLIGQAYTSKAIAVELGLSPASIRIIRSAIFAKIQAQNHEDSAIAAALWWARRPELHAIPSQVGTLLRARRKQKATITRQLLEAA